MAEVTDEVTLSPAEATAKLTQLKASATKEYSLKNYTAAADLYSEATELQATVNGEMSPQNAELLYAYGRCLYHVAISKSDVLGSKVAGSGGEEPKKKKRKVEPRDATDALKSGEEKTAEEVVEAIVDEKDGQVKKDDDAASKPFFQITGDENWTDSEDEDDEAEEGEQEEEDDDFGNAYEVLDLARVLLTRQLEGVDQSEQNGAGRGKGKGTATETISAEKRSVMERLADTHDLQAEIWLESERFSDAIPDFQSALDLKLDLYPQENSLVAEAHYKLSLALEFASIRKADEEGEVADAGAEKPAEVDEEMRKDAASHMEKAIASCRMRVEKEKALLKQASGDDKSKKEKNIKEVVEMIQDLEQRLNDLKGPPATAAGGPAGAPTADAIGGILGSLLGESTAEQKARIAEATKGANDLSGLIRKKPAKPSSATASEAASAKRKLDDGATQSGVNGKKVRVEDE